MMKKRTRVKTATRDHHDPALEPFIEMLKQDIIEHPERLRGFPHQLIRRIKQLKNGIVIDHDEAIHGSVNL